MGRCRGVSFRFSKSILPVSLFLSGKFMHYDMRWEISIAGGRLLPPLFVLPLPRFWGFVLLSSLSAQPPVVHIGAEGVLRFDEGKSGILFHGREGTTVPPTKYVMAHLRTMYYSYDGIPGAPFPERTPAPSQKGIPPRALSC